MNGYDEVDIDSLPFEEYAQVMCERGAAEFGDPNKPKLTFQEIVASDMTYSQIEAEYGEETAINSGIARDPDAPMMSLMKPISDAEERVSKATVERYGEAFTLIDKALELFIDRTGLFGSKKFESISKLQAARLHLNVRSIKSIRTAKIVLALGYYQQALTLLRMAAENDLVARDAAICSPTLDALLLDVPLKEEDDEDVEMPRFGDMAMRQSPAFKKWWDWYYGKRLSIYGAHPRNASMSSLYHHSPTEQAPTLDVLPFFNEDFVEPILCIMAAELWKMFESTNELVTDAIRDKTELDQPELYWTQEGLIDLGTSLYSFGYRYIFRPEEWQESEEQGQS